MSKDKTSEDTIRSEMIFNIDAVGKAMASCIKFEINEEMIGAMTPKEVVNLSSDLFLFFLHQIAEYFEYETEKDAAVQKEKAKIFSKIISSFIVHSDLDKLTTRGSIEQAVEKIKEHTAKSTMH